MSGRGSGAILLLPFTMPRTQQECPFLSRSEKCAYCTILVYGPMRPLSTRPRRLRRQRVVRRWQQAKM